jgi:hypothetical protein
MTYTVVTKLIASSPKTEEEVITQKILPRMIESFITEDYVVA